MTLASKITFLRLRIEISFIYFDCWSHFSLIRQVLLQYCKPNVYIFGNSFDSQWFILFIQSKLSDAGSETTKIHWNDTVAAGPSRLLVYLGRTENTTLRPTRPEVLPDREFYTWVRLSADLDPPEPTRPRRKNESSSGLDYCLKINKLIKITQAFIQLHKSIYLFIFA